MLRGHCLPYGEGITYWPLTEVVREILAQRGLLRLGVVERGDRRAPAGRGEGRPDRRADLRGARPRQQRRRHGRGDLVGRSQALRGARAAPPARDRLRRPPVGRADVPRPRRATSPSSRATRRSCCSAWRGPSSSTLIPAGAAASSTPTSLLLEPLDDGDSRKLIANLLGRGPLPADAETRIAEAADGNALFAEELLAMLVDDDLLAWDGDRWVAAGDLLAAAGPDDDQHAARRPARGPARATSAPCSCWHRSRARSSTAARSRELAPDVPETLRSSAASRRSSAAT